MPATKAASYHTSGFKGLLPSHQMLRLGREALGLDCPLAMVVQPRSSQTRSCLPLPQNANKSGKHLSCKPHFCFSQLLGMFLSCLSASPLLSGVSTRHFAPLYVPSLPAGEQVSPWLKQGGSYECTSTPIALTGQMHWRREPCRGPRGMGYILAKLVPNTSRVTLHIYLYTTRQQTEKTWSLLG